MKDVILILGMHRSGTSALTRVINLLGAALPRALLGQNASNTRGHWESELMIAEHDALLAELGSSWTDWRQLKWPRKGSRKDKDIRESFVQRLSDDFDIKNEVVVVKEPRMCRFSEPYIETLEAEKLNVYPVLMVRNPLEVAASLQARDGITKLDGLYLWLTHMLEAEFASRGKPRSFIYYDDLIQSPVESIEEISRAICETGIALPFKVSDVKRQVEDYVSPQLKRQSIADEATALDPFSQGWADEAYGALRILCENGTSKEALVKLDAVRASYFASIDSLHHALSIERARLETESNERFVNAVKSHEEAIEKVKADNERNWRKLESKYESAWAARGLEHEKALTVLQDAHKVESEAINEAHEVEYAALKQAHKEEYAALKEAQENEIESLQLTFSAEREALQTRIADLTAERDMAEAQAAEQMNFMRDEFGDILRGAEANTQTANIQAQRLRSDLDAVLNSTSWKLTGGIRAFMNLIKGKKAVAQLHRLDSDDPSPRLDYKAD